MWKTLRLLDAYFEKFWTTRKIALKIESALQSEMYLFTEVYVLYSQLTEIKFPSPSYIKVPGNSDLRG